MSLIEYIGKEVPYPKQIAKRIDTGLVSLFGQQQYRRFIVLSRSRTGSNLLISLLNSHRQIRADREIFNRLNGRNYKDILDRAFAKQHFWVKAKGFKIFYYHPIDHIDCGIWNDLLAMDDLYVIHLKRTNILHTLFSRKVAGIQDQWTAQSRSKGQAPREKIRVSFTVDELAKDFQQTRTWEEVAEQNLRNHPLLSVNYEDLVTERAATFRKVTDFLGVDYRLPNTELRKQNPQKLQDLITNYDELKGAFAGTEWAQFFEG